MKLAGKNLVESCPGFLPAETYSFLSSGSNRNILKRTGMRGITRQKMITGRISKKDTRVHQRWTHLFDTTDGQSSTRELFHETLEQIHAF
jgi:hypothetical protein